MRCAHVIDTSIIHDTLAVIANEVKQSSKTKDAFCLKHLDCRVGFTSSRKAFWIATSASPPRNDEVSWIAVGFASAALRSQLKPCCNDEAFWSPRIRGNACQFLISPYRIPKDVSLSSKWNLNSLRRKRATG